MINRLKSLAESDMYPYHMPGHKRNECGNLPKALYQNDITEIDGFDNLHQPKEIIKDLQEQAARYYGADESFYLVNGSTCGILAAISAAVPFGGKILISRNCHKSVYNAIYLRQLRASYLWPENVAGFDIPEAVNPSQISEILEKETDLDAVLIVSPTYEGRIADVKAIADIVHAHNLPLIVDEAHGAHLGFHKCVHANSCQQGADLVIHSTHKTLPALTQTALLHLNGERINRTLLKRFLHIYETSSPSYLLMASIDNALEYTMKNADRLYNDFSDSYKEMLKELSVCKHLKFVPFDNNKQDIGKLVISVKNTTLTGHALYDILREKYHLQLEMAGETYALAMFTINDTKEAYVRMQEALVEIDAEIQEVQSEADITFAIETEEGNKIPMVVDPIHIAWEQKAEKVKLKDAVGRLAADFVNLYPPGTPILVPGERIDGPVVEQLQVLCDMELNVQGIVEASGEHCLNVYGGVPI